MQIMKKSLCITVIVAVLEGVLFSETMVRIPGRDYEMMATEVTQELYESVMGENPSWFRNDNEKLPEYFRNVLKNGTKNHPVENVSWYDAIYFCNLLSKKTGYSPVYAVDGVTDVTLWNYTPHKGKKITGNITVYFYSYGYRLPTLEEWYYAAKGGEEYIYAGGDDIDEVGWYDDNCRIITQPVAQKKNNGYGLYDMSGNVQEWCWDSYSSDYRFLCGGSWDSNSNNCKVNYKEGKSAYLHSNITGFRLVMSCGK